MATQRTAFAAAVAAMSTLFFVIVNFMFSPGYLWFYYPVFAVLWFPLAALFLPRRPTAFALAGSALSAGFLVAVNLQNSPGHPWFLYACWPLVWWPIIMALGKKAGTLWFAALCAGLTIAWYAALNIFVSPGYPWALCPAFAVVWWPMTLFFARRRRWFGYSVAGTVLMAVFFAALNLVSSPAVPWAVFPVFAALWWPLSVYFFQYKRATHAR